jgi:hypothetical protein
MHAEIHGKVVHRQQQDDQVEHVWVLKGKTA